jgi:hypothetical protein
MQQQQQQRQSVSGSDPSLRHSDAQPQPQPQVNNRQYSHLPEERLVFTLHDGRVGLLMVVGRVLQHLQHFTALRPLGMLQQPIEVVGTALVAWGDQVVFGDGEGKLTVWETSTGRVTCLWTGLGTIRRIQVGHPSW